MGYARFGAMVLSSTIIMFGLMYLNTYQLDHVFYSQIRAWMAILIGAVMAGVMLLFMWGMYKNRAANFAILVAALVMSIGSLWLVRSQETVSDVDYMKAMIPHHSIAILTSTQAHIRDPRVRDLADQIIEAQVQEIAEMKQPIADLENNPVAASAPNLSPVAPEEVQLSPTP